MVAMQIQIQDEMIQFNVQYAKRKKISLHIDAAGRITVKAPKGTSEETVLKAVERHGEWIMDKLRSRNGVRQAPSAEENKGVSKVLYLGKEYPLHDLIKAGEMDEEKLKLELKKFYVASLKKVVAERITDYQTRLRVKPKSIEIVESRTKWGSCSGDRKLTFNYLLAMVPVEVIDYVIIHELCHLLHMNHDRSFWRRVGSIMPDYKEKEAFLARFAQYAVISLGQPGIEGHC